MQIAGDPKGADRSGSAQDRLPACFAERCVHSATSLVGPAIAAPLCMKRLQSLVASAAVGTFLYACASGSDPGQQEDVGATGDAVITGATIVSRAEQWVNAKLAYCQSPNHTHDPDPSCSSTCNRTSNPAWDPYRSDCSGFVSWSWALGSPGLSTSGFAPGSTSVSYTINGSNLQPGDALNIPGEHIILFVSWQTQGSVANFYEEPGCSVSQPYAHAFTSNVSIHGDQVYVSYEGKTFYAIRYTGVAPSGTSSSASSNKGPSSGAGSSKSPGGGASSKASSGGAGSSKASSSSSAPSSSAGDDAGDGDAGSGDAGSGYYEDAGGDAGSGYYDDAGSGYYDDAGSGGEDAGGGGYYDDAGGSGYYDDDAGSGYYGGGSSGGGYYGGGSSGGGYYGGGSSGGGYYGGGGNSGGGYYYGGGGGGGYYSY